VVTDLARAAWLLGCAALVLGACEVLDWLTDDDERITWRDVAFLIGMLATAVLAVASMAALP
jgi:hypothetical protein